MTSPKPAEAVDLEALKRVAEAANNRDPVRHKDGHNWYQASHIGKALVLARGDDSASGPEAIDAAFIAAASPTRVLAHIAELEQLRAGAPKWIACVDRMPELAGDDDDGSGTSEWVTVYAPARGSDMAFWDGNVWQWRADGYAIASEITHWMTLPAAPPEAVKP